MTDKIIVLQFYASRKRSYCCAKPPLLIGCHGRSNNILLESSTPDARTAKQLRPWPPLSSGAACPRNKTEFHISRERKSGKLDLLPRGVEAVEVDIIMIRHHEHKGMKIY